jgi:hypothetical protein
MDMQLPADKILGFPSNSKEGRMRVLPSAFHFTVSCIVQENNPISSNKITDIS